MDSYRIITAANDSYINTLVNFIESFVHQFDPAILIVYNLGWNPSNTERIQKIQESFPFTIKEMDYTFYPEHVNINVFHGLYCSYAFKPVILFNEANETTNRDKILIWMDSANRFDPNTIERICNTVQRDGIYTPTSTEKRTIESIELNHPDTVMKMGLSEEEHKTDLKSVSANLVAFDNRCPKARDIIQKWYTYSLQKDIIMPEGSSRNNHRQDQTVLSILIHFYEKENNVSLEKNNLGVRFWNKYDPPRTEWDELPFKLIEKSTHIQLAIVYCKNVDEAIDTYANRKMISKEAFLEKYEVLL